MAMSIVSASDVSDLLNEVAGFLSTQGWTVANATDGAYGSADDRQVHVTSPSGKYFFNAYADYSARTIYNSISSAMGSTASSSGGQPDESKLCRTNIVSNNYQNVYLFAHGDAFYCTVEYAVAHFRHFSFGVLDKAGGDDAYGGGTYAVGTYVSQTISYRDNPLHQYHIYLWDGYEDAYGGSDTYRPTVRYIKDATIYDRYFGSRIGTNDATRSRGAVREEDCLLPYSIYHSYSQATGRVSLTPIHILARDTTNTYYMPLGVVADARVLRIDNFAPKDTVTIGSDTWHIFPIVRKNGPDTEENSGVFGIAYRE